VRNANLRFGKEKGNMDRGIREILMDLWKIKAIY
jgi:hypothetical protein